MKVVGIYIQDSETSQYNRVDLFDDEKISVTSSIQNINDIAKTYTDFSQTFTVPATKQNNKIFKHWYENSNDAPFSTLVKSNAYIEIDTIPFRSGKIQLESANLIDGQPQDYSITFIGILGNLKDTFAGKYLKDLTLDTSYDFNYTAENVRLSVIQTTTSTDIMFPLISSNRSWNVSPTFNDNAVNWVDAPIRYNELFPAIKLIAVLNMIETEFGINFDGTVAEPSTFLTDARFTNAYLWLKNADTFEYKAEPTQITFQSKTADTIKNIANTTNSSFYFINSPIAYYNVKSTITITPTVANITYKIVLLKNGIEYSSIKTVSIIGAQSFVMLNYSVNAQSNFDNQIFTYYIVPDSTITFNTTILNQTVTTRPGFTSYSQTLTKTSNQTVPIANVSIVAYMPEIKIEDFFSGLLKMFNLTCYSSDGINYTVEQLESYYSDGSDIDITKYVLQDKKALNRVKTYKKINFDYEKSESFINVDFNSRTGIEYGSLRYVNNPPTEGEEYSIKLPFEDLNFSNLNGLFQVGYCLKTDLQKYVPKPIILYDYNSTNTTAAGFTFYWSNSLSGPGTGYTTYKAFGQETLISGETYGLNFNEQQSTLTNDLVPNSLYRNYYEQYFNNIYNLKARLIKLSAILPTSILTTLKLNDNIVIRDAKYLINSYTTDLTTGEVQFELLTDQRVKPDKSLVLNLDAGIPESYPGTGTLWTDLSIYGNNGTLINGPTFDSANDGSIVFDGVDDYVTTLLNSSANNTTSIIWYKWDGVNKATTLTYLGNSESTGLGFYINNGTNTNTAGNKIGVLYGGAYYNALNSGTLYGTLVSGIYTQLTLTRDGSTTMLYQNGVFLGYTTRTPNASTSSLNLKIGGVAGGLLSFGGAVPLIQFYNRALSSTEILAKFNQTKGRYGL